MQNVKKYIEDAINELKGKAQSFVTSKILAPVHNTQERISTASNNLKSSIGSKINTERIQLNRAIEERKSQWALAKVNASNSIRNSMTQPVDPNSLLGQFGIKVNELNTKIENNPFIGKLSQIPEKYGTLAGEQIGAGIKQMGSGQSSNLFGVKVPSYIAGPAKVAMGGLNLTPAGVMGSYAYEGSKGIGNKAFGEDTLGAEAVGLVGALVAPNNFSGKASKTQKLLKGLEKEATKFDDVDSFINSSPKATQAFEKWFSEVWLKLQKPSVQEKWAKNFTSDMASVAGESVKNEIRKTYFDPILKNIYGRVKDNTSRIETSLANMGKGKNIMEGTFNESYAQTAMRRKANLKPADIYDGTIDVIRRTEQKLKQTGAKVSDSFDSFMKSSKTAPKDKINIFDFVRTPDRVMEKIGLGKEAKLLRTSWDSYLEELPKGMEQIGKWAGEVNDTGNKLIFKYLDGQISADNLLPTELKVANEVKDYLTTFAKRLGLEEDSRITNYITHIWEKDTQGVDFPEEIAGLIRDKVAGSVYDPFVQKRLGNKGYIEDTWRALEAYTKRGLRKVHMDGALDTVKKASEGLEDSQFKYVKNYIDRINMRPTDIDTFIDNAIKASPWGFKSGPRPTATITQNARRMVYRGLLGLNPASALKNLSQASNTYAELGEKYTFLGYVKVAQNIKSLLAGEGSELHSVGVLRDNFIQDRQLSATKKIVQNMDKGLFYLFNLAEKINRGGAYWGAKAKYLKEGFSEAQAIEKAKEIVRKTQFSFGSVDTPAVLSSDIAKTIFQFQSFGLKQIEFLGEKVAQKDIVGLIRYTGASYLFMMTIGKLIGFEPKDMIPSVSLGTPPTLQIGKGLWDSVAKDENSPDKNFFERVATNKDVQRGLINYIPAGSQIKKSVDGFNFSTEGGSYKNDKLQYPNNGNIIQNTIFGKNVTPEADEYFKNPSPLSENQTEVYKALIKAGATPREAYAMQTANRGQDKKLENAISGVEEKKPFNLVNFIMGKKETLEAPAEATGDSIFDYLNKQLAETKQTAIIKEILSKVSDPVQAEKALQQMGIDLTYEEASTEMIKSLDDVTQAEYLYKNMSKLTATEFGEAIKKFVSNDVLTSNVVSKMVDAQYISEAKGKELKNYILMSKGKKFSAPKTKRFKINGKIKTVTSKIKLPKVNFKPLKKIATPKLSVIQK